VQKHENCRGLLPGGIELELNLLSTGEVFPGFHKRQQPVYHGSMSRSLARAGCGLVAGIVILLLLCTGGRLATPLSEVRSWAFQLQNVDPIEIALSPYDLVVIDYGFDRRNATAFPREVVELMRRKPRGGKRVILAYVSIGEAENYRYYWQDNWRAFPPEWLQPENPEWPGNYLVQYWNPGWQAILFGNPNAYLDRVLAAGFDGVYLDGTDAFEQWISTRPSAASDMIDLIGAIASYGRAQQGDFLVIPQNGERLLENPRFVEMIDGFAREDLLYSETEDQVRNPAASIVESLRRMRPLIVAAKPILAIEYTSDPQLAASALHELKELGLIGYVARRDLRTLSPPALGCGQPDCSQ
jgi:cysteinyl-tRNA synthetase